MANQNTDKFCNRLKDGQPDPLKHDVRLLIEQNPACKGVDLQDQTYFELDIAKLLDAGFVLANFNTVADGAGSPTCVALMIKRPKS
jgi:hypothetical protein